MYKFFNKEQDPKMIGLSDKLMSMLDNARTIAGVPFVITSGLRSEEENKRVGGVADSAHLKGLGADIACENSSDRYSMLYGFYVAGFKRIEICERHLHVDIDESKDQRVCFFKK